MSGKIYNYYKMLPKNWDKAIVNNPRTICARAIEVVSVPGSGNGDPLLREAENKFYWNKFGKKVMNKNYIDMRNYDTSVCRKQHNSKFFSLIYYSFSQSWIS